MARSRADEGMGSSERRGRSRGAAGWERRARRKGTANKEVLSVAAKPPPTPEPAPSAHRPTHGPLRSPCPRSASAQVSEAARVLRIPSPRHRHVLPLTSGRFMPIVSRCLWEPCTQTVLRGGPPGPHTAQTPRLVTPRPPWIFPPQHAPRLQ